MVIMKSFKMGAFHDGHLALMRAARERCDSVVVSLFVNPTQFNEQSDLEAYPRDEARDAELAREQGVDLVWAPTTEQMYPPGFATTVQVQGPAIPLEGAHRGPEHFQGVATVVLKLFNVVRPDVAYFGQKDAQQVAVIRRLVKDLDVPVELEIVPIVREPDGLALSSRNVRLDAATDRPQAIALRNALNAAEQAIAAGTQDPAQVKHAAVEAMRAHGLEPEYLELVDPDDFSPTQTISGEPVLVAVAARVGPVRLIDNVLISPNGKVHP